MILQAAAFCTVDPSDIIHLRGMQVFLELCHLNILPRNFSLKVSLFILCIFFCRIQSVRLMTSVIYSQPLLGFSQVILEIFCAMTAVIMACGPIPTCSFQLYFSSFCAVACLAKSPSSIQYSRISCLHIVRISSKVRGEKELDSKVFSFYLFCARKSREELSHIQFNLPRLAINITARCQFKSNIQP